MINFFRKTRKKMADDNRPLKYMRYAIGEIVLVVVGILIALQINAWKEERKSKHLEYVTLSELKKNIDADVVEMSNVSELLNKRLASQKIILHSISNNNIYHDSLNSHFGHAIIYDKIAFHTGAYESLKSSGIQLINDETLRFEISNYYDFYIKDMEEGFTEIRDDFYNYMLGYLRHDFKYYYSDSRTAEPRDFEALKQNKTFIISLRVFQDVMSMNLRTLRITQEASIKLLERINLRLEKINKR